MARASKSDIYVAVESFAAEIDGETMMVRKGVTRVRAGHPLLKVRKDAFELVAEHVEYDVDERATANPGEKRGEPKPKG